MFYMNYGTFNEGEQADAYKAKKREERHTARFQYKDREHGMQPYTDDGFKKNWVAGDRENWDPETKRNAYKAEKGGLSEKDAKKHSDKMKEISRKGSEIAHKHSENIAKKYGQFSDEADAFDHNFKSAVDAANRHVRRHPEAYKEEGIFAEACFIDE